MSKKVLVTGGAGYIGSHTVVELVKSGYDPIILDDYRNSDSSVLKRLSQLIGHEPMHVVCDVCDQNRIEEIVETYSISGVIHFAAYKAVGESVENPLKYYSNNIAGLVSVLSVLKKRPEIPFVFSSSCTVYGEPMGLKEVNENTAKSIPTSPYGYTKWLGEQIIDDLFISNKQLRMMSLRYFNPIGAHESALIGELPVGKPNNLLPFITQTAADIHEKLVIFGKDYPTTDGTCVRDYIHVVDLAEAHVKAMDYLLSIEEGCHEIVNVGTGKGTSVLELVRAFEKENNMELNYVFGPKRSGDVIEIYANVDYAFSLLGWRSSRNIKDAVRDAWKWEKSIRNIK
jgi:UDP-glucose 4-epimerase